MAQRNSRTDPPPGAPRRPGPRPLPLHLATQAATLLSWPVGWPPSNAVSPAWKPQLRPALAALQADLAGLDPDAVTGAVDAEARRRLDSFLAGIAAYRTHPYRRSLADPPCCWRDGATRLLDYGGNGVPVLLVPSLINRSYILDLGERRSLARYLTGRGQRSFLVDWGTPGAAEAGFGLVDYIGGRLEAMLAAVVAATGRRPVVVGYCMGGLLALALASRRPDAVAALALLATPWDFHAGGAGPAGLIAALEPWLEEHITAAGGIPVDVLQAMFAAVDPTQMDRKFRAFAVMKPKSRRAHEFVALEDWLNDGVTLVPGVARECLFGWYGRNEPARGTWSLGGQSVRPESLRLPCLVVVPSRDRLVPPATALALAAAIPGARCRRLAAGHIGMVAGRRARTDLYHPLSRWIGLVAPQ